MTEKPVCTCRSTQMNHASWCDVSVAERRAHFDQMQALKTIEERAAETVRWITPHIKNGDLEIAERQVAASIHNAIVHLRNDPLYKPVLEDSSHE